LRRTSAEVASDHSRFRIYRTNLEYATFEQETVERLSPLRKDGEKALDHGHNPPTVRNRHKILHSGSKTQILKWIKSKVEKGNSVTQIDILQDVLDQFGTGFRACSANSFIIHRDEERSDPANSPQESSGPQRPRGFHNSTIEQFKTHDHRPSAEFLVNLERNNIAIPMSMKGEKIHHETNENLKHASVIVCVTAPVEWVTPDFVSPQVSDERTGGLRQTAFGFAVDLILRHGKRLRSMPDCLRIT